MTDFDDQLRTVFKISYCGYKVFVKKTLGFVARYQCNFKRNISVKDTANNKHSVNLRTKEMEL